MPEGNSSPTISENAENANATSDAAIVAKDVELGIAGDVAMNVDVSPVMLATPPATVPMAGRAKEGKGKGREVFIPSTPTGRSSLPI
ncbi:hypothetical protein EW026_g7269 [Hermanssonia centrifuga]|uniref:Uncharacterized protein n=1 Tax=Hermanssonia centrifuga TaxID=98765 RepID=A0A4S4K8C4_9APHY|nr:hypothetical protein EW026_g7269 [Hermanssonia centrifuga]